MKVQSWGASDVGQTRKVNEDTFVVAPDLGLVAVADGMGGFQRGDVASQLACNVLKQTIADQRHILDLYRRSPGEATRTAVKAMIEMAVQKACEEVHNSATAVAGEGGRMGTTMDVLLIVGTTAFIAHVGDGRIYLLRGSETHQLTEDHSLVQQQLREGLITPDEARRAKFKNVITRALGVFPSVLVDSLSFELDRGDRMLLCSDGLYRYIGLRELNFTMGGEPGDGAVSRLVALANQRGGRDNITVVLTAVEAAAETIAPTRERMEVLRKVDLFQYCTYRELMSVCQLAERREVKAGTVLFQAGDAGRECFVIERGQVSIERAGTSLAMLTSPDYFGEMSFIDIPRRSADAVAVKDSAFYVIDRNRFLQLIKQDSELAAKLMWQLLLKLSTIVRKSNERLVAETVSMDGLDDDTDG